ncbi:glycosyltransferase family 2 protein [Pontibacter saemangeumensis]|uniref:Glycosyltransferase family 2 protein n=1 Tax=Pontibacter saemangeumensis TaxID=1084525 RepID=A0ABP8LBY6_9BACT
MKLSIVTINYNNVLGLENTLNSLYAQSYRDYELILIDGGSTDGSTDVIKCYSDLISYWVSEADKGVYNALNKGILQASGEYLFFLNSGDYLVDPNVLSDMLQLLNGTDIIYGNLLIQESHKQWEKKYPANLTFDYFIKHTIPHSGGAFIKKNLFDKVGFYDETLRISSDWKFYVRAICSFNATFTYVDKPLSVFGFDGISSQAGSWEITTRERKEVLEKEYNRFYQDYIAYNNLKSKFKTLSNSRFLKFYLKLKSKLIS